MIKELPILVIGALGVFATGPIVLAPVIASTIEDFLNIESATVDINDDELDKAKIQTEGDIQKSDSDNYSCSSV
jgi:hypothetical protein